VKERPILFSAPMVCAILDGRKTQTRRMVKPQPYIIPWCDANGEVDDARFWRYSEEQEDWPTQTNCPYGQIGDTLIPAMEIPSLGNRYCADILGRIWSRAKSGREWRLLKGAPTSKGYLQVTPVVGDKYPHKLVHRLVAEAFYGPAQEGQETRHLDGNPSNNAPENLAWGSAKENWTDRSASGSGVRENHYAAKLTKAQTEEIQISSKSQRALAKQFGVSQTTIYDIKSKRTWNPLPKPAEIPPRWASRITLEIVSIRVERLQEITEEDARCEGVEPMHLDDLGQTWKTFKRGFQSIWDSIYGNWDANPYVWVVQFRRVEK
jgi:hypothetical protein